MKDCIKILIVDKSFKHALKFKSLIENGGYSADIVLDGREAMSYLNSSKTLPSLIISDIKLPNMDGLDLCSKIKDNQINIPIIIFTTNKDDNSLQKAFDAGAKDFLRLPVSDTEFIVRVNNVLKIEKIKFETEQVFNVSTDCMRVIDFDYNILQVNNVLTKILGLSVNEIIGKKCYDVFPGNQCDTEECPVKRMIINDSGFETEAEKQCPNGKEFSYILNIAPFKGLNGKTIGVIESFQDDTQLKNKEKALREDRDFLESLVITGQKAVRKLKETEDELKFHSEIMSNMAEGVNFITANDGIIQYCNPKFEKMFDYEPGELIGSHVAKLNAPTDKTPMETAKEIMTILEKTGRWYGEIYSVKKDGTFFWSYVNCSIFNHPVYGRGIVSAQADITERKVIEELALFRKMEAVGQLAGGIAHDFNNILMGILGNIFLSKRTLAADHPGFKFLEQAEQSMNRGKNLTSQLLTFAKGGGPVKQNIKLSKLVEEVSRFDLTGSNVKLVFKYSDDLWVVNVDKGQMEQVFSNLTINANQAMPDGGVLYITLEKTVILANEIIGLISGKYIKISVRDSGHGIDPENIDRIFDPFFSTKQKGHGLGLATVYSIINKHKGCIKIDSKLGKGTTFTIYLPASESQQLKEKKHDEIVKQTKIQCTNKILVMDDEEMICKFVKNILKVYGYSVSSALDGKEAIEMYKKSLVEGKPFNLIIMDLTIPGGMGGKETVKRLLEINQEVKCIVSSGYANDPVLENYKEYGFKGILNKPYTIKELNDVLNQVLGK